ncbi:MAG: hypothetical protein EBV03_01835, partial [Proteobacteria bacterium]|nr:hypothetical protein [Pseudomonadota bacterium]
EARYSSSYSAAFLTGMLALGAAAMKSKEDTKDSSIQDFFRKMAEGMMTYAQAAQSVSVQQKLLFINPKI